MQNQRPPLPITFKHTCLVLRLHLLNYLFQSQLAPASASKLQRS